jgi:hypothetical protein
VDFRELLDFYNVPNQNRIKLYRHAGNAELLHNLHLTGQIEEYQKAHSSKILECDLVAFFLGLEQNQSLFLGFYTPNGCQHFPNHKELAKASHEPDWKFGNYIYDLYEMDFLSELQNRLVVDFGPPVRSAHRWLNKMGPLPVMEIRPKGRSNAFPGYANMRITFQQLLQIINNPMANQDWKNALSAVSGIYSILVTEYIPNMKGQLYIGSACGGENLWQRFKDYANTGHGGNKLLYEILENNPEAVKSFQFSLLQTAPITASREDVLEIEAQYKMKLGTREFGLNAN